MYEYALKDGRWAALRGSESADMSEAAVMALFQMGYGETLDKLMGDACFLRCRNGDIFRGDVWITREGTLRVGFQSVTHVKWADAK